MKWDVQADFVSCIYKVIIIAPSLVYELSSSMMRKLDGRAVKQWAQIWQTSSTMFMTYFFFFGQCKFPSNFRIQRLSMDFHFTWLDTNEQTIFLKLCFVSEAHSLRRKGVLPNQLESWEVISMRGFFLMIIILIIVSLIIFQNMVYRAKSSSLLPHNPIIGIDI